MLSTEVSKFCLMGLYLCTVASNSYVTRRVLSQNPFCGANRPTKAFVRGLEMKQHFDTVSKGVRDQQVTQNIDCQEHSSATMMLKRRAVVSVNILRIIIYSLRLIA